MLQNRAAAKRGFGVSLFILQVKERKRQRFFCPQQIIDLDKALRSCNSRFAKFTQVDPMVLACLCLLQQYTGQRKKERHAWQI
jgi:hypothetical protein